MEGNRKNKAAFRFYEELNDFLPKERRKKTFTHSFDGNPAVKDPIEAMGVPHTEVDLILVNGKSVGFDYHLKNGDRVSVYPVFETFDISPIVKLRGRPLRKTAFVLDVHLGRLARLLRMAGFDAKYQNDYTDRDMVQISVKENRIILTRDRGLLCIKEVQHGYWLRSTGPREQLREVVDRFDLYSMIRPFHRCMVCNGRIKPVDKESILDELKPKTKLYYDTFHQCEICEKIYWKGSHYTRMKALMDNLLKKKDKD
jgi:uncharacterized protein with PIN domain